MHGCISEGTCEAEAPTGLGVAPSWARDVASCAALQLGCLCVVLAHKALLSNLAIVISGLPLCKLNHRDVKFIQAEQFICFTLAQVIHRESLIP